MFCPNCGNNCADANFCSNCGTKLPQKAEQPVEESLGQPCPRCGGILQGDKSCTLCGEKLEQDVIKEEESYEIPYKSIYISAASAYIHIAKTELSITKKGFLKKSVTQIPYIKLKRAVFYRDEFLRGSICLFWENGDASAPNKVKFIQLEIGVGERCAFFFHVFYLLKVLAPQVECVTCFAKRDIANLERFSHISDLENYYIRFAPYRNRAISAIVREYAIPDSDARDLVDALFNQKEQKLYESNPILAVRDYNRIKAEEHREYEEMVKEMKERGLKRYR